MNSGIDILNLNWNDYKTPKPQNPNLQNLSPISWILTPADRLLPTADRLLPLPDLNLSNKVFRFIKQTLNTRAAS